MPEPLTTDEAARLSKEMATAFAAGADDVTADLFREQSQTLNDALRKLNPHDEQSRAAVAEAVHRGFKLWVAACQLLAEASDERAVILALRELADEDLPDFSIKPGALRQALFARFGSRAEG